MMIYEFKEGGVWLPGHGILIDKREFKNMVEDMPEDW